MMQQNSTSTPSWLQIGFFIDIKDKQGDWRVALVHSITKTQIRVKYEGWPSKFDENFMLTYSNIRPFRSVIRGYTGPIQSPPPRQNYKFTQAHHKDSYEALLTQFIETMYDKSQFQINQFIRGSHYFWVQYLMTFTYTTKSQIQLVFQYFFKHFQLLLKYLKDMLATQNFQLWINGFDQNGIVVEGRKAFADAYYEIFDNVYSILDGYPRLKSFFKNNAALISQFIAKPTYIEFMSEYISSIGAIQILEQVINKLFNDKKSKISLNFAKAFTRLFSALQKTILEKQKRKQLVQKYSEYILRECTKLTDISIKQEELQVQQIYSTCKAMLLKYTWKTDFLIKFQIININCWKCMILSQKLERKIKAINSLKTYLNNLNSQKKQFMMIFNTKQSIQEELRKQEILHSIFYQNEHHEIIKKGCELASELFKDKFIGMNELEIVWKSCRHRLEAVRKVMYVFFEELCKDFNIQQLQKLISLILSQEFAEQIDKTFFYNFFRRIMQYATQQKSKLIEKLFDLVELRLPANRDEIKIFSQLLTMKKSFKFGYIQKISNKIIDLIGKQKNDQTIIFYLSLANDIFAECGKNKIEFNNDSFFIIFGILCNVLKSKIKKQQAEDYRNKKEKIYQLLKMVQYLETNFDFQPDEFTELWTLFGQEQNSEFRQSLFLPWILIISHKGMYKLQSLQLNKCFQPKALKKQIFNKIFRKHPHLDYISLSEMQFKIFKKFMLAVNADLGNLRIVTNYLTSITYFRILQKIEVVEGIKELFDIFLNCRNEAVVQKAAKLLNQMHLNQEAFSQEGYALRAKKVDDLLSKIQKYIADGMKRSNIRLVKNALFLLADLAITVKQTYPMPQEFRFSPHGLRPSKKLLTIKSIEQKILIKQLQVVMTSTIKNMKKRVCDELKIAPYNLKMYKQICQYKKVDDEGGSYDDASASSAQSYDNSKSSVNYHLVKKSIYDEIAYEIYYAPVSCLMLSDSNCVIVVKQVNNTIYESIQRFVNQKISQNLLKILGDPDYYSKQSSELAYTILIDISCSLSSTSQIINNLIILLSMKNKANPNAYYSIGLCNQSVHFKMYFCRNLNKLQIQQLCEFLSQKNAYIYNDIFNELSKQIVSPLQIQLFIEIIGFIKKGLHKNKITTLSSNTVFSCMINILEFNAGLKQTKQYKKEQKGTHLANQICVFMDCFYVLEKIEGDRVDGFIIQHEDFAKIMGLMYQTMSRSQFSELFENKMGHYFRAEKKLHKKSEQIMYRVIFDQLYSSVKKMKKKSNSSFFKLTRDLILISSPGAINKLFSKNEDNTCFWQNCLEVIANQSDHYSEMQKENKLLSGHLIIFDALIKKHPAAITEDICRMILFNCLCYKEGETVGNNIKCVSKNSIHAALTVLSTFIKTSQKYSRLIVSELRKNQQTKYWRTPDFWNVSIELEMKSPCGFVGLENPGCICYLNSFTQTLFMNEEFRKEVISFSAIDPSKDYSLLHELRKIFLNLQFSNQKYLNPVPFTKTIKNTEDKPMIKLFEQMDIEEYSSILFDKIQKLLPKDQDFVKQIFGGTYSNDIISQECKHCSQREESFLSMQLDVKATLADSLKTLVKGQLLQGQNAYYCEKCNKKVKALKRMSIKKLPNNLIICLKRFEYNFETDQKFKVNSCCQFPRQVTLEPYSQQSLSSEQQLQQFNQKQGETGVVQRLPHEYFEYKLKGVIIHTGSSESGHYYALIQTSRQPEKWLEFNDSSVTDFDIENLPQQAFGSDDPTFPKYKNAYMLVYERKNKINLKHDMYRMQPQQKQSSSSSTTPYQLTKQSTKILDQIKSRNKEIQTFHTIFTPEYNHFICEVIQHTINTSHTLTTQYRSVIKQINPTIQLDDMQELEILMKSANQVSKEHVEDILKFYLEYCLFVRAREISIHHFIDFLYEIECLFSTEMLRGVMDYYLGQLRQQLLVQQLFIEVSFKDKLTILAHFTCQIVLKRLKYKTDASDPIVMLVIQIVETFMCVMIQNGNCCNELLYIIRRIMDEYPQFVPYFQRMNLFNFIFEIVAGICQSADDKINKSQRLKAQVQSILLQDFKLHLKPSSDNMQQQINQLQPNKYEIKTVNKTGKCVLKQQSPQQAWNYLYIMYQYQTRILRQHQLENQYFIQSQQQSKSNSDQSLGKIIQFKREVFLSQFGKIKNSRIEYFIEECQGSKASRSLALFLCEVMHNCEQITDRLLCCILKGLKGLEVVNFRSHLVLLYYMVMHEDQLTPARSLSAVRLLTTALVEKNSKYFSETDVIHQWIMKMTVHSAGFTQAMTRTEEGIQLFNQIIERIEILKKPSQQLLKKQKNPNYQRLNYIIHGLTVSSEQKDYDTLYQTKKLFFTKLFHEQPFPKQLQLRIQPLKIVQPTFQQLTHKAKPGQILFYLLNKKWIKIIIKSCRYGFVRASRLMKQTNSDMKTELEHNFVNINGTQVEIGQGYKMCDQQFHIWQMEEKLVYNGVEEPNKPLQPQPPSQPPSQKQQGKQQKYSSPDHSSRININRSEPDSNISYQSSSHH